MSRNASEPTGAATASGHPPVPKLTDEQVQQFIVEGMLEIPPDPSLKSIHESIYARAEALGKQAEALGNNILPALPELLEVFESPACKGALSSLLGPDYLMHPHRFCHKSKPGRKAQTWHRDSFWGHWFPRNPQPSWVMALYFPQDTPFKLGPTGVLPRSQYWNKDESKAKSRSPFGCARFTDQDLATGAPNTNWHLQEQPLTCKAGTIVLIHYDLFHRGAANISDEVRYMFKFQFSRTASPGDTPRQSDSDQKPDWSPYVTEPDDQRVSRSLVDYKVAPGRAKFTQEYLVPVWQEMWDWLHGCRSEQSEARDLAALIGQLELSGYTNEPKRVGAAAVLGHLHPELPVSKIVEAVNLESVAGARVIEALGHSCLEHVLLRLQQSKPSAAATHALGHVLDTLPTSAFDADKVARDVADYLLDLAVRCKDVYVRNSAAGALGAVRRVDVPGVLIGIVCNRGAATVRATACHSLLRLLPVMNSSRRRKVLSACERLLAGQNEAAREQRYILAYAAELQHRICALESGEDAFEPLMRYCPWNGWQA